MGSSESSPEVQGWRILEVIPKGPCYDKGLCVYFDFIVGINGVRTTNHSEEFWDIIKAKQDTEIILTVFNYKTRMKRDIEMTPTNDWGGDGLLGLVIVRDDFTKCDEQCARVLTVEADSPASKAGLTPETDYILGTPINAFTNFSIFRETISEYIDQALPVYVYNSATATVRLVEIRPSSQWHGEGVLGCEVGDGYLHHIPSLTDAQTQITFQPSACYVVSSSTSSRNQSKQGSPAKQKKEKETETQETTTQAQAGQTIEVTEQAAVHEMKNGHVVEEDEVEDAELPSMVRWTDSSNKIQHSAAETTTTSTEVEAVAASSSPKNLLVDLEQETQRALAAQQGQ